MARSIAFTGMGRIPIQTDAGLATYRISNATMIEPQLIGNAVYVANGDSNRIRHESWVYQPKSPRQNGPRLPQARR
jgi:hypothetical protein